MIIDNHETKARRPSSDKETSWAFDVFFRVCRRCGMGGGVKDDVDLHSTTYSVCQISAWMMDSRAECRSSIWQIELATYRMRLYMRRTAHMFQAYTSGKQHDVERMWENRCRTNPSWYTDFWRAGVSWRAQEGWSCHTAREIQRLA